MSYIYIYIYDISSLRDNVWKNTFRFNIHGSVHRSMTQYK